MHYQAKSIGQMHRVARCSFLEERKGLKWFSVKGRYYFLCVSVLCVGFVLQPFLT